MTPAASNTPSQRATLSKLARKRAVYERRMAAAAEVRKELNELIVLAAEGGLSTYKIAEKVAMSQPRVVQLLNDAKAGVGWIK